MIPTPIRRNPGLSIKRDIKREQILTSKTGIHPNDVVNDAINQIEANQTVSGSGLSIASNSVPWLLKKRRELELRGEITTNQDRGSSTSK